MKKGLTKEICEKIRLASIFAFIITGIVAMSGALWVNHPIIFVILASPVLFSLLIYITLGAMGIEDPTHRLRS